MKQLPESIKNKICPCCGSQVALHQQVLGGWMIICNICWVRTQSYFTLEDIIATWDDSWNSTKKYWDNIKENDVGYEYPTVNEKEKTK